MNFIVRDKITDEIKDILSNLSDDEINKFESNNPNLYILTELEDRVLQEEDDDYYKDGYEDERLDINDVW